MKVTNFTRRALKMRREYRDLTAAGFFSTSAETIEKVYGHHSPEHQATAVRAVERR